MSRQPEEKTALNCSCSCGKVEKLKNGHSEEKEESTVVKERRKNQRLKKENEIAVTVIDDEKKPVKGKRFKNHSLDISVSGAKIKSSIPLSVDTLIMIKMKLKNLGKIITTVGKVKWTKGILKDKFLEAGIEFVDTPSQLVLQLEECISQGVDIHDPDDK